MDLKISGSRKVRLRGEHMSELTAMMNIGKEMAKKLQKVGIDSPEELAKTGVFTTKTGISKRLSGTFICIRGCHL